MTVKAIRLKNFMAFEDTGWIELRPITLLFGKNSSGKSAIIRALRLLKQSLEQCKEAAPLAFAVEDGVDVGSFRDMVHQHELEEIVTFGFRCDFADRLSDPISQRDTGIDAVFEYINRKRADKGFPELSREYFSSELDLLISFAWDVQHKPEPIVVPVAIQIDAPWEVIQDQGLRILFSLEREHEDIEEELRDERDNIIQEKSWRWLDNWFPWSDFLNERRENLEKLDKDLFESAFVKLVNGFLPDLDSKAGMALASELFSLTLFAMYRKLLAEFRYQVKTFLEQIAYVGPVRPEPARSYSLNQFEKRHWERQGWQAFLEFLSEEIDQNSTIEIGEWLGHIGQYDIVDVDCRYSGSMGLMSSVEIKKEAASQPVNIVDVGFGVSQVLPVIVQSVLAKPGQLVIIEQPELHLHPSAQAKLMDVFLVHALEKKVSPSGKEELSGMMFMLETHSEHLILRLMRRMRETFGNKLPDNPPDLPEVSPDECAVFYVEWFDEYGFSEIADISLDVDGRLLDPWPGGFFEEDFEERFA